jgi:hypothetical protein
MLYSVNVDWKETTMTYLNVCHSYIYVVRSRKCSSQDIRRRAFHIQVYSVRIMVIYSLLFFEKKKDS